MLASGGIGDGAGGGALCGWHVAPDVEGDLEAVPMLAGESCSVVTDIKPAAAVVHDLVRDTEAALG